MVPWVPKVSKVGLGKLCLNLPVLCPGYTWYPGADGTLGAHGVYAARVPWMPTVPMVPWVPKVSKVGLGELCLNLPVLRYASNS